MDTKQELDVLHNKDIKQIKLTLIKSFTKSIQPIDLVMTKQQAKHVTYNDTKYKMHC